MSRLGWSDRLFHSLLCLLPREFRERYGREIVQTFRAEHQHADGVWQRMSLWLGTAAGIARTAPSEHWSILRQDIRHAFRTLSQDRGFATAAVLTLALGIGGTTAIFGLVNTIFFRPLPFAESERLLRVDQFSVAPNGERRLTNTFGRNFEAVRVRTDLFAGVVAEIGTSFTLVGGEAAERVAAARVSAGWGSVLGVAPLAGRLFTADEERLGDAARVALVGERIWRSRLNARAALAGTTLGLDGRDYDVIGVLPDHFKFPYDSEIWVPDRIEPAEGSVLVIARTHQGITPEQVNGELAAEAARLAEIYPDTNSNVGLTAMPLRRNVVEGPDRVALLLLGAVAFLLLIACANVAHLLLVRFASREREIAVRASLGASRIRQVRQLVTESAVLFTLGGAAGLVLAMWLRDFLVLLIPRTLRVQLGFDSIALDLRVLLFAAAVSLTCGGIFGLIVASRAGSVDINRILKEETRGSTGGRGRRTMALAVVGQVAIALMLLAGAGLLAQSFNRLQRQNLGFDPIGLLTMQIDLSADRYGDAAARIVFVRDAIARLERLTHVRSVGATTVNPICCGDWGAMITVDGAPPPADGSRLVVHHRMVTPSWFRAMGIVLQRGRQVSDQDVAGQAPVVVIDERMARRFWPNQDPIGRRVKRGLPNSQYPWLTVVGVVSAVQDAGDYDETWYLPYYQNAAAPSGDNVHLMIRAAADATALVAPVRRALAEVDASLAVHDIATMDSLRAESLAEDKLSALLVAVFAGFGLLLAGIGIYGVTAHGVRQRTHEIGIRLALGAEPQAIRREVVASGLRLAALGIVFGLAGAFLTGSLMRHVLFDIAPSDGATLAGAAMILSTVAALACWIPSRRATRVDPLRALRNC